MQYGLLSVRLVDSTKEWVLQIWYDCVSVNYFLICCWAGQPSDGVAGLTYIPCNSLAYRALFKRTLQIWKTEVTAPFLVLSCSSFFNLNIYENINLIVKDKAQKC